MNQNFSQRTLLTAIISSALLASTLIPLDAGAEGADLEARILQLEQTIQHMQQQRAEQDEQLALLSRELLGIEHQTSQSKIIKAEEKGSSKGAPVYAMFKDGIKFEDGSGDWNLQFNGRVQADYRAFSDDVSPDTWSVRRARLNMQVGFYKNYLMRLELDSSAANTRLINAYVEANWWPQAKIRLGQFKVFKGLENSTTDSYSDFMERSLAYNTYADDIYERGAMVYGSPFAGSTYALAVTNGTGQGNDEVLGTNQKKDGKDLTLRATINPAQWSGWDKTVTHVGGWYNHGVQATTSASASQTEARGISFFVPAAFGGESIDRNRYGVETAIAYSATKLQAEYNVSNYNGVTNSRNYDKDVKAWYAEAMWLVSGENYADSYKDGQFGRILPKSNFALNKAGWGALELGLRYSSFDASDFNLASVPCISGSGCLTSSMTNQADAWTTGAKWILNPYSRILVNYVHTKFASAININGNLSNKEDAVTMRAQLDF